ncbi:MAG: GNAT family N-acetyltransferase [Elainella sp.]
MTDPVADCAQLSPTFGPADPSADLVIARHFYQLWRDNSVAEADILPDWQRQVQAFIATARRDLGFQAFVAEVDGQIVGSASCQRFAGLYPLVLAPTQRDYGYIWGVYVEPAYRRRGLARQLTQMAADHLKTIGCTHALLHASPSGKPVYAQLGFLPTNEMRLDLRADPP